MKICQCHDEALRKGIKRRGMGHLHGQQDQNYFEPYKCAEAIIHSEGFRCGGIPLLLPDKDGNQQCPLCEVNKHLENGGQKWIDECLDALVGYADQYKLIPRAA